MSDNNWWASNNNGGVKAHTPDETQYHYPDSSQTARMRGGIGSGVIIPRANDDGTSKGFDGRVAGTVHVDPEAPDGGTIVDLSRVQAGQLRHAFQHAQMPHEVYYQLGQPARQVKQASADANRSLPLAAKTEPPRLNSHVPSGTYVVPKAFDDGTQFSNQETRPVQTVPPMFTAPLQPTQPAQQAPVYAPQAVSVQAPQPYSPEPQPQAYQQPPQAQPQPQYQQYAPQPQYPQYAAPVPPGQYDNVMQHLGQLTQVVHGLADHIARMSPANPVPPLPAVQAQPAAPLSTTPRRLPTVPPMSVPASPGQRMSPMNFGGEVAEESEQSQTVAEYEASSEPRAGIIAGFETLRIPCVTGPLAKKARKSVYFAIPGAGNMCAKYHDVVVSRDIIVLVYDTRYEEGVQYSPPDLGDAVMDIVVQTGKEKVEYRVTCPELVFSFGVFDMAILLRVAEPDAQSAAIEDDEE